MWARWLVLLALVFPALPAGIALAAPDWELGGEASLEVRVFPWSPQHERQAPTTASPSLAAAPELEVIFRGGDDLLTFTPCIRADWDDDHRTHFDVRELAWTHLGDGYSFVVGFDRVFWGVTESRHLVDIVNQTDLVEDIDGEDKLGQPMVALSIERDRGALDLFFMPIFRERTFPAAAARLSGPLPVRGAPGAWPFTGDARYTSSLGQIHPDFAIRYAHAISELDIGIAHFRGTSREPRFVLEGPADDLALRPYYDLINQTSVDLQWTRGAWLWKLEAIGREGHGSYFGAVVAGFEYTQFQTMGSDVDIGWLAEVLYDGRDRAPDVAPPTRFENDVFLGARVVLNDVSDTTLLLGDVIDLETGEMQIILEAQRRLGERWLVSLDARFLALIDESSPLDGFRNDSYLTLRVSRFF